MADIFISYKREDRRIAERLSISLEQLGFDVWWDFELLSGDQFRRVIEKVIDQCAATLVLWSNLSRDSTFVVDEASYAKEQGKLCPARIDDCRLPLGFGGDHVIDLRGWDGEMQHEGLQTLLRSLEAKTSKQARLGARARDANDESRYREMEAFKIAQAAQNASALRAFLRDYPAGAFSNFVRGQLEEVAAQPGAPAAIPALTLTSPPGTSRPPPQGELPLRSVSAPSAINNGSVAARDEPKREGKSPWLLLAGGALATVIAVLVIAFRPWEQSAPPTPASAVAEAPRDIDAEIEAARGEERERAAAAFVAREELRQQGTSEELARQRVATEQAAREEGARDHRQADDNAWTVAQRTNTNASYSAYLNAYPNGQHVEAARLARFAVTFPGRWDLSHDNEGFNFLIDYTFNRDGSVAVLGNRVGSWRLDGTNLTFDTGNRSYVGTVIGSEISGRWREGRRSGTFAMGRPDVSALIEPVRRDPQAGPDQ